MPLAYSIAATGYFWEKTQNMSSVSTKMLVRLVTLAITRLRGVELLVAWAGAMAC